MANKSILPFGSKNARDFTTHFMPYQDALKGVDAFRIKERNQASFALSVESGELFYSVMWNNKALDVLRKQKGCKGTKAYLAHFNDQDTLILVGVDKHGHDIKNIALDAGQICPPHCGPDDPK